jgi:hypothetical protein
MARELMVEEYKSLRMELQQLAANVSRWQQIGFVSAGTAVAVGIATNQLMVSAAALLVISGCMYGIIHDITSILRIAAYLQAFHEGQDTGALWENRLEKARGAYVFVPLRGYMTPIPSLWWVGFVCSLVPVVVSNFVPLMVQLGLLYSWLPPFQLWPVIIPVLWIIQWIAIRPSFRAFGAGGFKDKTLKAFYDSLSKPDTK